MTDLCLSLTLSMQCCLRSKFVIFSHFVASNSNLAWQTKRAFSLGSSLHGLVIDAMEEMQNTEVIAHKA